MKWRRAGPVYSPLHPFETHVRALESPRTLEPGEIIPQQPSSLFAEEKTGPKPQACALHRCPQLWRLRL